MVVNSANDIDHIENYGIIQAVHKLLLSLHQGFRPQEIALQGAGGRPTQY